MKDSNKAVAAVIRWETAFLDVVMAGAAVCSIAALFNPYNGWLEILCHFRMQYLVLLIGCSIFYALLKQPRRLAVAGFFAVLNLFYVAPFYLKTTDGQAPRAKRITCLYMNVLRSNRAYHNALEVIRLTRPDIVAVTEVTPDWETALNDALKEYKFSISKPRTDSFGIGLWSKIPLENASIQYLGSLNLPTVESEMKIFGKTTTVLVTHPVPPGNDLKCALRDGQLKAIAEKRKTFRDSLILFGDLNTTSWSDAFQNFRAKMKVNDTRLGFGVQPTWPAGIWFLCVPIDHVLASPDWVTLNRRVLSSINSDHYPILIELAVRD